MNNLQVVHEQEVLGKQFKVYGTQEELLFLAKDVAHWIEHTNTPKMMKMVDECERVKIFTNITNGSVGSNSWFLTEDGLYEVLMQSRKPIAKQFKKQVKEILKAIREDGGYIATTEDDDEQTKAPSPIGRKR
jgi:prophage antirepressor-like protein